MRQQFRLRSLPMAIGLTGLIVAASIQCNYARGRGGGFSVVVFRVKVRPREEVLLRARDRAFEEPRPAAWIKPVVWKKRTEWSKPTGWQKPIG